MLVVIEREVWAFGWLVLAAVRQGWTLRLTHGMMVNCVSACIWDELLVCFVKAGKPEVMLNCSCGQMECERIPSVRLSNLGRVVF